MIVDCEMEIICAKWNHDGSILAIGGIQTFDNKEANIIQFYDPWGQVCSFLKFNSILTFVSLILISKSI